MDAYFSERELARLRFMAACIANRRRWLEARPSLWPPRRATAPAMSRAAAPTTRTSVAALPSRGALVRLALAATRRGGRVIVVGDAAGDERAPTLIAWLRATGSLVERPIDDVGEPTDQPSIVLATPPALAELDLRSFTAAVLIAGTLPTAEVSAILQLLRRHGLTDLSIIA